MRPALLALFLAACSSDPDDTEETDTETEEPAPEPDADVHSYLPDGYTPANPQRIIFLGDSITARYGASTDDLAYTSLLMRNVDRKWPGFETADLRSAYDPAPAVIDVSVPGATTDDLLDDQIPALEAELGGSTEGETIIAFTIGGNDLQQALNPLANAEAVTSATYANFEAIFDWMLDGRFPDGVWIYATNVYEPSDGEGQTSECFFGIDYSARLPYLDGFNDDLRALGEARGVAILDLRGHFLGHGYAAYDDETSAVHDPNDGTLWLADDCIHPNNRGHHEIRRLFFHAIVGEDLPYVLPE